MSAGKWLIVWIASTVIFVLLIAIFNFTADPFQHYRKASQNIAYFDTEKERYLNPGLAKNYQYESILIGSSMTENFLISDLKIVMQNPIKLCLSGGSAYEIKVTLDTALTANKNIKTVLIGLDFFALSGDKYRMRFGSDSLPDYLYDDNILNDYKYLLIADTMKESIKSYIRPFIFSDDVLRNYENMYQWEHFAEDEFSSESVMDDWTERIKNGDKFFVKSDWDFRKQKISYESNIESIIKENPDIDFIIYFPPYCVLTYIDWKNKKIFEDIIAIKKYIANNLLVHKNLQLYDFQNDPKITTNLNLYKDIYHHSQKINSLIARMIAAQDRNYKVDVKTYASDLNKFEKYVTHSKNQYPNDL